MLFSKMIIRNNLKKWRHHNFDYLFQAGCWERVSPGLITRFITSAVRRCAGCYSRGVLKAWNIYFFFNLRDTCIRASSFALLIQEMRYLESCVRIRKGSGVRTAFRKFGVSDSLQLSLFHCPIVTAIASLSHRLVQVDFSSSVVSSFIIFHAVKNSSMRCITN